MPDEYTQLNEFYHRKYSRIFCYTGVQIRPGAQVNSKTENFRIHPVEYMIREKIAAIYSILWIIPGCEFDSLTHNIYC